MKKAVLKVIGVVLCLAMLLSAMGMASYAQEPTGKEPIRISVSMNGDSATQRGFCWYTEQTTRTQVKLNKVSGDVVGDDIIIDGTSEDWEGYCMHKAIASDLEAGATYRYTVGDGTVWSNEGTFVTDNADDSFSFITISDVQASSLENFQKGAATLSAAFATMPEAEFVVNCGDFTNDSTNEEWNYYSETFTPLNLGTTLVPVAGNHDGLGVEYWFNNMFNLDTSESVQIKDGVNYSYDYGNAHFAVLNTNDVLSMSLAQLSWLKNDMNSTDKDWKIVFMHKAPYTLGKDGKWPDALYLQESLTRVLDDCNVDLVMYGHDHMYLRTKPLTGNKLDDNGVTYVLAGTAGSKRYEVRSFLADRFLDTDHIAALTVQKGSYGNYWNGTDWNSTKPTNIGGCFNCISVDGGTLTLNSYILSDETGEVTNIDTYAVTKTTGQNTATFSGDNTTSEAEYNLSVVPSFFCLAAYTFCNWLPRFLVMVPALISVYINEGTF